MKPVVATAVEKTFVDENLPNPRFAEIKRRSEMAKKIADELKHDLGWSKQRIADNILVILKAKLVGLDIDVGALDKRVSW